MIVALEEQGVDVLGRKGGQGAVAQLIASDRAHDPGVAAESRGMAGEVGGGSAEMGLVRKDVPQHLAEADDVGADDFRIHVTQ